MDTMKAMVLRPEHRDRPSVEGNEQLSEVQSRPACAHLTAACIIQLKPNTTPGSSEYSVTRQRLCCPLCEREYADMKFLAILTA